MKLEETPRQPWYRKNLPWWAWVFIILVRAWTVVMTLLSLAVVVVVVMLFLWVARHPGRTDVTPFFRELATHVGITADSLGGPKR